MDNLSRKGHRQRAKDAYLNNSLDSMPDHNVLELILFYAIPQRDVKPVAYNLINRFGSLENVLSADVGELAKVDGIGEHSATLLKLFSDVHRRLNQTRAKEQFNSFEQLADYAALMLGDYRDEVVLVVTLDNQHAIIHPHIFENGSVNIAAINKKDVAEVAIRDNASAIVLAHNHPNGDATPSAADINSTQSLGLFLRQINVALLDHIVVGSGGKTQSIKGDLRYAKFFDK